MAYTSGTHPLLEDLCSYLAADLILRRNPREDKELVGNDHWVLQHCQMIGKGEAEIPTVT